MLSRTVKQQAGLSKFWGRWQLPDTRNLPWKRSWKCRRRPLTLRVVTAILFQIRFGISLHVRSPKILWFLNPDRSKPKPRHPFRPKLRVITSSPIATSPRHVPTLYWIPSQISTLAGNVFSGSCGRMAWTNWTLAQKLPRMNFRTNAAPVTQARMRLVSRLLSPPSAHLVRTDNVAPISIGVPSTKGRTCALLVPIRVVVRVHPGIWKATFAKIAANSVIALQSLFRKSPSRRTAGAITDVHRAVQNSATRKMYARPKVPLLICV